METQLPTGTIDPDMGVSKMKQYQFPGLSNSTEGKKIALHIWSPPPPHYEE